jgi:hypothetical protein
MSCDPRADHLPLWEQMIQSRATIHPFRWLFATQVMVSEQRRQIGSTLSLVRVKRDVPADYYNLQPNTPIVKQSAGTVGKIAGF